MKTVPEIANRTKELIDDLRATCSAYGLGGDGNEYKIIVYMFLYKFLNDKFGHDIVKGDHKAFNSALKKHSTWDTAFSSLTNTMREDIVDCYLLPETPRLKPEHFLSHVWNQQAKGDFSTLLDNTLVDIAKYNEDIFSMTTESNTKLALFEPVTIYVPDQQKRDDFAKALVSRLTNFSFAEVFKVGGYDFFSTIFEYLIKDYNKDGGGKYAEYYTPHAVATIMAKLLVKPGEKPRNVTCYDPSAGTGTLLMAIAHAIGEDRCEIYSQDISQKSSKMLRLNLILNNLVHSIPNVIQGDTLVAPYHRDEKTKGLKRFDYIVSNPPFNLDFSDSREKLASDTVRFFAGVPKVPKKDKNKMAIYLCFLQHIIGSLSARGKACVVVPTGFLTSQQGVELIIRKHLIDKKMLAGVVSMPSSIFATTGTNVSVLFFDKTHGNKPVILIDASRLGEKQKDGKNQRTFLSPEEIQKIIDTFHDQIPEDGFSVEVSLEHLKENKYSFSAGQYFDVKQDYVNITEEAFRLRVEEFHSVFSELLAKGRDCDKRIEEHMKRLKIN